jgi:NADH-quinone oxidoreductase subunit I
VFDIDISVCMSCQICVEVCPFESIKMDKVYELSARERFGKLLLRKDDLAKSNEYYNQIRPTEAAAVDAALAAQAEEAARKKAEAEARKAAKAAEAKAKKETEAKKAESQDSREDSGKDAE